MNSTSAWANFFQHDGMYARKRRLSLWGVNLVKCRQLRGQYLVLADNLENMFRQLQERTLIVNVAKLSAREYWKIYKRTSLPQCRMIWLPPSPMRLQLVVCKHKLALKVTIYPVKTTTFDILWPFLAAFMMKLENFGNCKTRNCSLLLSDDYTLIINSVADTGCLSRMRIFSITDPNFPIPDPHRRI